MNVRQLQRTDRWLGVPLCCGLTLARFLSRLFSSDEQGELRRILFVKLAEQGSTVLAYGALRRAVERVGRENVYFIAFEENRFILDALEVIPPSNVVIISSASFFGLARTALAALVRLRRIKPDAAVDLEFFSRGSAVFAFLSGAERRVGFHAFFGAGPYRGNLMTHRLLYNPYMHTSDVFRLLVEALDEDPKKLPALGPKKRGNPSNSARPSPALEELPQFKATAAELEKVRALIKESTGSLAPLILLNPNASDMLPLRRWPAQRYVQLAKRLLASLPEAAIVFTGARSEAAAGTELARQVGSPRCVSLAGKTNLRELLVLYCLAEVLVTNDSGPAHFAMLTPIRVVTLFGPETPALFAARSPLNSVLYASLPCSPCVNAYNNRQTPCQDNLCMQAIEVDEVFKAVCEAWDRKLQT